jgi:hypothetical protein
MKSSAQMNAHLRVRLSQEDMNFLLQLARQQKGRANISRVVKQMIENARDNPYNLALDAGSQKKVGAMAQLLRRTPVQVVSDAIDAVESLVKSDEPPLLVMELKLVNAYRKKTAKTP